MWDVIVVGAGPAGCSAAYDLAHRHKKVLLLDKSNFPRVKACAGGISIKTMRALRYSIEPVVQQVMSRVVVESGTVQPLTLHANAPVCMMTVRSEFDHYCLGKTLEAGAEFRKIRNLKRIEQSADRVMIETDSEVLHARFVVGADGVHSAVRSFCKDAGSSAGGFALEGQVPLMSRNVDMTFDISGVRNGYGWIFPKGDHLNVGVGYFSGSSGELLNRDRLVSYVRSKLGTDTIDHVVGQYLGCSGWDGQHAFGRILLAGDAAGLVDTLTGEGIYSAVVSGQLAAHAIGGALDGTMVASKAYQAGLSGLRKRLSISTKMARVFYANPDRTLRALSLPGISSTLLSSHSRTLISWCARLLSWTQPQQGPEVSVSGLE